MPTLRSNLSFTNIGHRKSVTFHLQTRSKYKCLRYSFILELTICSWRCKWLLIYSLIYTLDLIWHIDTPNFLQVTVLVLLRMQRKLLAAFAISFTAGCILPYHTRGHGKTCRPTQRMIELFCTATTSALYRGISSYRWRNCVCVCAPHFFFFCLCSRCDTVNFNATDLISEFHNSFTSTSLFSAFSFPSTQPLKYQHFLHLTEVQDEKFCIFVVHVLVSTTVWCFYIERELCSPHDCHAAHAAHMTIRLRWQSGLRYDLTCRSISHKTRTHTHSQASALTDVFNKNLAIDSLTHISQINHDISTGVTGNSKCPHASIWLPKNSDVRQVRHVIKLWLSLKYWEKLISFHKVVRASKASVYIYINALESSILRTWECQLFNI